MSALLTVILPVFLVVGAGYLAAWRNWFSEAQVDALMRFAQNFAAPFLLFQSISRIELSADYDMRLLASYYIGAFSAFFAAWAGAKYLFKRSPEDCVAIGFTALFANTLLLGVAITERAYGPAALTGNWVIISIHSPLIYTFGITLMEFTRARGLNLSLGAVSGRALRGVLRTPLVLGIIAGFVVNFSQRAGLVLPEPFWAGVGMIASTTLPTALFALGGILLRYRPEGDAGAIALTCAASLLLHPLVTYGMGRAMGLELAGMRSAVITASMAPGVNAYIFAHMYGAARRVAASTVLVGTALSVLTIWMWLMIVG